MIKSFRHKELAKLFEDGESRRINPALRERVVRALDILDSAERLGDLNFPGYRVHPLKGKPLRYALSVSGPWRITFEWIGQDAWRVDLEQYH